MLQFVTEGQDLITAFSGTRLMGRNVSIPSRLSEPQGDPFQGVFNDQWNEA